MNAAAPALAISCSNAHGDLAADAALRLGDGRIRAATPMPTGKPELLPCVAELCRTHGIAPSDLRELRLDLGPGSYTGLRQAVTFAKMLHWQLGVAVLATDTLQMLAAAALAEGLAAARLVPVLDARRERLHSAAFTAVAGCLHVAAAPAALPCAATVARLLPGDLVLAPAALQAQLQPLVAAAGARIAPLVAPRAATLFEASLAWTPVDVPSLEPLYLMATYAEGE